LYNLSILLLDHFKPHPYTPMLLFILYMCTLHYPSSFPYSSSHITILVIRYYLLAQSITKILQEPIVTP
jgi:hypothetical protein